jgi:hypothetical protein
MVTISFPLFSGLRLATWMAAKTFAPVEMPARRPFLLGQTARHDQRVLVAHGDDFIDDLQMEIGRHETGAGALDLVRAGLERLALQRLLITGESFGSTAIALKSALRGLITSATPVIVPPVPTAETRMSILPSVSFQISSAVVLR